MPDQEPPVVEPAPDVTAEVVPDATTPAEVVEAPVVRERVMITRATNAALTVQQLPIASGPVRRVLSSTPDSHTELGLPIPLCCVTERAAFLPALLQHSWCTMQSVWRLDISAADERTDERFNVIGRFGAASARLVEMTDALLVRDDPDERVLTAAETAVLDALSGVDMPAWAGTTRSDMILWAKAVKDELLCSRNGRGLGIRTQVYIESEHMYLVLVSSPVSALWLLPKKLIDVAADVMREHPTIQYVWEHGAAHWTWVPADSPMVEWFLELQRRVCVLVQERNTEAAARFCTGPFAEVPATLVSQLCYGQLRRAPANPAILQHFNHAAPVDGPTFAAPCITSYLRHIDSASDSAVTGLTPIHAMRLTGDAHSYSPDVVGVTSYGLTRGYDAFNFDSGQAPSACGIGVNVIETLGRPALVQCLPSAESINGSICFRGQHGC